MPGGGSVQHHQVPPRPSAFHLAGRVPPHLAEHDDLGEGRRRVEEIADDLVLEDEVVEGLVAQDHQGVFAHRLRRPDVHREQVAGQLLDLRARRGTAEQFAHPLARRHFANEDALAAARGRQRECGGDGALPRAAFARDHQEPPVEQRGGRVWHGH